MSANNQIQTARESAQKQSIFDVMDKAIAESFSRITVMDKTEVPAYVNPVTAKCEQENQLLGIDKWNDYSKKKKAEYVQAIERAYMDSNDESDCVVNIHAKDLIGIVTDSGEEFLIDREFAKSMMRFFNFFSL